jgi:hypothetical protein
VMMAMVMTAMVLTAMVMTAMVMTAMVMVIIVQQATIGIKASTDLERSISQSFHRLRAFH